MPNPFTRHPDALGETYLQHLGHALNYSGRMFLAGGAALVHALLPFLFEKTASNMIKAMYAEMAARGATAHVEPSSKIQAVE
ncbi:MAG: DUF6356 family protein [Bosea sp. (in: a-proteobacteria)]